MKVLSEDWVKAVIEGLKNDPDYQKKTKGFDSSLQFFLTGVPGSGDMSFGGKFPQCDEYWVGKEKEGCDYTIRAEYPLFKDLIEGKISAVMALMQKKIKIEGNMSKVMKYVGGVNRMIDVIKGVPTEWA